MTLTATDHKGRIKELNDAAEKLLKENDDIVAAAQTVKAAGPDGVERDTMRITADQKSSFDENLKSLREIKAEKEELESIVEFGEIKDWASAPAGKSVALDAQAKAAMAAVLGEQRASLGKRLLESDEWKAFKEDAGTQKSMRMEVGSFKDIFSTTPTGAFPFGSVERVGTIPLPMRKFRVRDLFPSARTNAAVIQYFRVTNLGNAASVVPERSGGAFALKPQSALSVEADQAAVQTIAHWEVAHRNVLDDEPQLQNTVETLLMYGLQLEEDLQILSGTGTGNDLLGILNTPGIQTQARGSDTDIDAIRKAMTKSYLSYYEPTGIVLHPTNWETIELAKDSQGRYLLFQFAIDGVSNPQLWRLPVAVTPAMTLNTGLVGSFGLGAQLYDRQEANIRVAEQHADYFVRNAVVILAEERLALTTIRPQSFISVTGLQ